MRSKARRHAYPDFEERTYGMRIRCPACNHEYEDEGKERLIPLSYGWIHNVCPACYLAYLKVRVKSGERLTINELHSIGKVRSKFRPDS
jgi:hypothetical protein